MRLATGQSAQPRVVPRLCDAIDNGASAIVAQAVPPTLQRFLEPVAVAHAIRLGQALRRNCRVQRGRGSPSSGLALAGSCGARIGHSTAVALTAGVPAAIAASVPVTASSSVPVTASSSIPVAASSSVAVASVPAAIATTVPIAISAAASGSEKIPAA